MIDPEKRKTIFTLSQQDIKIGKISFFLKVSRNAVRQIIKQEGQMPDSVRADKITIDEDLLARLYADCQGRIQRIHEKLTEEEGINIGYSTLTRLIRELGLDQSKKSRCGRVPDQIGAEMQHDTTVYKLSIGDKKIRLIASILYFRYCKMRYLKFYQGFNRFKMKCFFHEALTFFGYSAPVCIIDNTNLARLRGTGKNAVIVPEMEQFARQLGFQFLCHEKGHANRKAGNERSFYTVETNFLPGRSFESLEDLNKQALDWATVRMANRKVSGTSIIPAVAFEAEKPYLIKLPPLVPPPYLPHTRVIDEYGYLPFDGNFYWVPGTGRGEVLLLQYSNYLKVLISRKSEIEYPLPPHGVKNQIFSPQGLPKPAYKPRHRTGAPAQEEQTLRAASSEVEAYLDFLFSAQGRARHLIIREIFSLYQKINLPLFIKTIRRALQYRVTETRALERIAMIYMTEGEIDTGPLHIDEQFQERKAYLEGRLSDQADLSVYEKLLEDESHE